MNFATEPAEASTQHGEGSRPDHLAGTFVQGRDLDLAKLEALTRDMTLADVILMADRMIAGGVRGRLVLPINPDAD